MKINIKKLSELSGFSAATVSNALNGKRGVNHETAQQILALAREYGYVPASRIQSIRLVTYRDSGEVFSDAPFLSDLIESIENESRRNGYETKLVNLYRREADYEQQVEDLLGDTSSAILLVGTELSEEDAKAFLNAQVPLVLLDCAFENLPFQCVLMENENAVAEAVRRDTRRSAISTAASVRGASPAVPTVIAGHCSSGNCRLPIRSSSRCPSRSRAPTKHSAIFSTRGGRCRRLSLRTTT